MQAIPTTPRPTEPAHFRSDAIILVEGATRAGGPGGWGLGGWTAEGEGRLVFRGPMIQGPVAYLFGRAGVIDNHGGTAGEHRRGHLVHLAPGDRVSVAGTVYTVSLCPRGYPKLTRCDD